MFLNLLSDTEKKAFLGLSYHAASANGVVEETETLMIQEYCKEMNIEYEESDAKIDYNSVIEVFKGSDIKHKKISFIEIIGLLYSDGKYDETERNFAKNYANKIGLADDDVEQLSELIKEYLRLINRIYSAIDK